MTLAIHHALRTSERATQFKRATQFIGRFQTAPRLKKAHFRGAKGDNKKISD